MNSVTLIGRLAKDPELSYTPNTQTAACRITLAVDRPKRNDDAQGTGDYVRSADFIRVTAWGRLAENCDRFLRKGRQVAIQGRIQTGSYKNRNGETVYTTDVIAEKVEFLGSGNQQQAPATQTSFNTGMGERAYVDSEINDTYKRKTGYDDMPDTFQAAEDEIPF